jgi:hypothetical protein
MTDILIPDLEIKDSDSRTLLTGEKPADAEKTAETKPEETPETPVKDEAENEESAPSEDSGDEEDSTDAPKKSKGVQKRIDELTRQRYQADRDAERARQEAEYWRRQAESKQPPPQETAKGDAAPRFEDFDSYDDYTKALARFAAQQEFSELKAKEEGQRNQERQAKVREAFDKKAEEARRKYDDYDVVAMGNHVAYSPATLQLVVESEVGAELAYYLGKNPDVAKELAHLSPILAAKEIGRLEERFKQPKSQPKKITNAPPPISPVGSNDKATKNLNEMSTEEYIKHRRAQMNKRR